MSFQDLRNARILAYADEAGISIGDGGMPAYSTADTLRRRLEQMGDQEYMITVEIGGKDEYDETV